MCGRFTLRTPAEQVARAFELPLLTSLLPRYNIAPTQHIAVVRVAREEGRTGRQLVELHWGLIPRWAKDPAIGNRMINARSETVATKPSFRQPFKTQRCLVIADGFYEWKRIGKRKQPYYMYLHDHAPFAFAGLWEHWRTSESAINSCTILTTQANSAMRPIHDRMPVILAPDQYDAWLDPDFSDRQHLQSLLTACPAEWIASHPVDTLVNSPRNDQPRCVQPVDELFE